MSSDLLPLDAVLAGRYAGRLRPGAERGTDGLEIRGFALFVGISEAAAEHAGWRLADLVGRLEAELRRLSPTSEVSTSIAVAPLDIGGRDLDVTRVALHDPVAVTQLREIRPEAEEMKEKGLVIDTSRRRVLVDGAPIVLTFAEFELLALLVRHQGRALTRRDIVARLAHGTGRTATPTERSIDVGIRRLRSRLEPYDDVIVTARGVGYRFTRRATTTVLNATTPSPDVF